MVEHGSVSKAAEALGAPRPTVSKRLARLEERLGVRLLHRTTRRMSLTAHGERLFEKARRVVRAAEEAEADVQRVDDVPRGLLRVQIPSAVPQATFTGWIAEFLQTFPEVSLDLVGGEQHVDMVSEGFDVALRNGPIGDQSLMSRTLVVNQEIAVASPTYLERRGTPESVADLAGHNCIIGYRGGNVPDSRWPLLTGGSVAVQGDLMTNHVGLRLEAAKRHLGIAMLVDRLVAPELADGSLLRVLPDLIGRRDVARLVYPERRLLEPKVRAFIDFMVSKVKNRPEG